MERGRHFYITLISGIISAVFIICALCFKSQMVFELKPYARVVLGSGHLGNWTADSLHLDPVKFDEVKRNYQAYLKKNRVGGDDSDEGEEDESDSDESDVLGAEGAHSPLSSSRLKRILLLHANDTFDASANDTFGERGAGEYNTGMSDSSSSSEDDGLGESSESSEELTLEQRLVGVPVDQTVSLGLFGSKVCSVALDGSATCETVPVITGLENVVEAAGFAERELDMSFWNNVRMESLFSLVAVAGGLICLLATLRPCCDIEQTPKYLGAVSFFSAGILAVVPVIRIAILSADFRESLEAEQNITTELRTPWSVLLSAFGGVFSLIALGSLILSTRMTTRLYRMLSTGGHSKSPTGNDVMLQQVPSGESFSSNGYYDANKDGEKIGALIVKA